MTPSLYDEIIGRLLDDGEIDDGVVRLVDAVSGRGFAHGVVVRVIPETREEDDVDPAFADALRKPLRSVPMSDLDPFGVRKVNRVFERCPACPRASKATMETRSPRFLATTSMTHGLKPSAVTFPVTVRVDPLSPAPSTAAIIAGNGFPSSDTAAARGRVFSPL